MKIGPLSLFLTFFLSILLSSFLGWILPRHASAGSVIAHAFAPKVEKYEDPE